MDHSTIKTMIEASHASIPQLAHHFKVSPSDLIAFLGSDGEGREPIKQPTALDVQYKHIAKLYSAQRPESVDWELLLFDDANKRFINGIDTLTTDGRINANDILAYYGQTRCVYSGEVTSTVMAADGSSQNFLISNLIPVTTEIVKERRFEDVNMMFVCGKDYEFVGPSGKTKVGIHLHSRFDRTLGAAFNTLHLDALVDQWIKPWFELFSLSDILPIGMVPTPEVLSLWVWRQLSSVAFVKGLARVEVVTGGVSAFVTKDSYIQTVVGLMQRAAQSRAVTSRPSSIITPQQAAASGLRL